MSVDFAAERRIMVDSQVRPQDVTDLDIIDAMSAVRREDCLPPTRAFQAYADTEVEYAPGRWMLRPRDVAKLLQGVRPRRGEQALAIAAPYAGAVMQAMGLDVTRFDGEDLSVVAGPWDVMVCEGAVSKVPDSWPAALAVGGRLAVVERNGPVGQARLYARVGETVGARYLFDCTPPIMAGFEARRGFVF
jgi:protein-L-isoaspartate(D-aspartate) O-methyltransferase